MRIVLRQLRGFLTHSLLDIARLDFEADVYRAAVFGLRYMASLQITCNRSSARFSCTSIRSRIACADIARIQIGITMHFSRGAARERDSRSRKNNRLDEQNKSSNISPTALQPLWKICKWKLDFSSEISSSAPSRSGNGSGNGEEQGAGWGRRGGEKQRGTKP